MVVCSHSLANAWIKMIQVMFPWSGEVESVQQQRLVTVAGQGPGGYTIVALGTQIYRLFPKYREMALQIQGYDDIRLQQRDLLSYEVPPIVAWRTDSSMRCQFEDQWSLSLLNFDKFMNAKLTPSAVAKPSPISSASGMPFHSGRPFIRPQAV